MWLVLSERLAFLLVVVLNSRGSRIRLSVLAPQGAVSEERLVAVSRLGTALDR